MRVREIAKNRDLTVDELMNMLLKPASKGRLVDMCSVWGQSKAENMARHMAKLAQKREIKTIYTTHPSASMTSTGKEF
jgi:CO dehydrogenase/acetyl-CoA synthase epsilon subunit